MSQKTLDANELLPMLEEMVNDLKEQKSQFSDFFSYLRGERAWGWSRDFLRGRTASNIERFWLDAHRPFTILLRRVIDDFEDQLDTIKKELANEFYEQAMVKETFLMDELHDELNQLKTMARRHGEALDEIKGEFSDVVTLPSFHYETIDQGLSNAQREVEDTTTLLHEKDQQLKGGMTQIAQDITTMNTYVDHIRGLISDGSVSIHNYNSIDLKFDDTYRNLKGEIEKRRFEDGLGIGSKVVGGANTVIDTTQNMVAGASIAIGHYGTGSYHQIVGKFNPAYENSIYNTKWYNGAKETINKGGSMARDAANRVFSPEHMTRFNQQVTNVKDGFRYAGNAVKTGATMAAVDIASNKHVKAIGEKLSNFKVSGAANHMAKYDVLNKTAARALGPIGWGLTGINQYNEEFNNPANAHKTDIEKGTRFVTGTLVEGGAATAGAIVGGAVGTLIPIPGMTFVGAAVGGIAGGWVGSKVAPVAKDLAESAVNGIQNAAESVSGAVSKGVETVSNGIKDGVGNLAAGVAGWFS